jgi:hypothetical protein
VLFIYIALLSVPVNNPSAGIAVLLHLTDRVNLAFKILAGKNEQNIQKLVNFYNMGRVERVHSIAQWCLCGIRILLIFLGFESECPCSI